MLARMIATLNFTLRRRGEQAADTNPRPRSRCVGNSRVSCCSRCFSFYLVVAQEMLCWSVPPPPYPPHPTFNVIRIIGLAGWLCKVFKNNDLYVKYSVIRSYLVKER